MVVVYLKVSRRQTLAEQATIDVDVKNSNKTITFLVVKQLITKV